MDIVQRESAYNTQNMGDPTSGENTFNDTDENKTTKNRTPPNQSTNKYEIPFRAHNESKLLKSSDHVPTSG